MKQLVKEIIEWLTEHQHAKPYKWHIPRTNREKCNWEDFGRIAVCGDELMWDLEHGIYEIDRNGMVSSLCMQRATWLLISDGVTKGKALTPLVIKPKDEELAKAKLARLRDALL